jgi:DNA invertase Pin-like site-specific DNA recombinase
MKDDFAPTQIVGYYRVSTKEQGAEGLRMAAQRDAVIR